MKQTTATKPSREPHSVVSKFMNAQIYGKRYKKAYNKVCKREDAINKEGQSLHPSDLSPSLSLAFLHICTLTDPEVASSAHIQHH